jgi:hypothetical protein
MDTPDMTEFPPSPAEPTEADAVCGASRGLPRSRQSRVRRQRIREHQSESLKRTNAMLATIGCITADLAELEQRIARAVLHRLHGGTATVEEIEEYKPTIDMMMRTTKLVAQNCRLECQLVKELLANSPPGPRESASEEIARCAPTRPRDCDSTDGSPAASCEPTPEVADT